MAPAPPTSSAPSVNAMVCSSKTFENQGVSPKDQMGHRGCSFVSGGAGSSNGFLRTGIQDEVVIRSFLGEQQTPSETSTLLDGG